jgi:hypothetical protein
MTGAVTALLALSLGVASAQTGPLVARAADVSGRVLVSNGAGLPAFALTRGYALNPGNQVDTRGGGRLVIDLSDGSMVVVHAETLLTIKDYRAAASLRELFDIAFGLVRVRINHFAGKPNPYRMNSPTASVAVRGTEFTVAVEAAGDTQVEVYEGLVEVRSLTQPDMGVLIEAGRGVMVRRGQDFQMYSGPSGRGMAMRPEMRDRDGDRSPPARAESRPDARNDSRSEARPPALRPGGPEPPPASAQPLPPQPTPQQQREPAFGWNALPGAPPDPRSPWPRQNAGSEHITPRADIHNDDDHHTSPPDASPLAGTYERYLANLAELNQTPFLYRFTTWADPHLDSLENPAYATTFRQAQGRLVFLPSWSGLSGEAQQFTALAPGATRQSEYGVSPQFSAFVPVLGSKLVLGGSVAASQIGDSTTGATSSSRFLSNTLTAASRWGRHSFGLSFDRLQGDGAVEGFGPSDSRIAQRRVTAGYSLDLARSLKVGMYARYGGIEASDLQRDPFRSGTRSTGHSTEAGVRLRGTLTPRLSYGVTAQWMGLSLADTQKWGPGTVGQRDRMHRETLGLGLGYLLTRRTVLTFDLAGGLSHLDSAAYRIAGQADSRFGSAHVALQRDVTRRLFTSASYLQAWRGRQWDPFPGAMGVYSLFGSAYRPGTHFSDFGAGCRFTSGLTAQYIFSTSYGATPSAHAILVRYTFRLKGE